MKKIMLAFALVILVAVSAAQESSPAVSFGVKAGLNLANLHYKSGDDTDNGDLKAGLHAGLFARLPIAQSLAFQPELLFSMEGTQDSEDDEEVKFNLNYIELPLMLQFGSASGFYAEIGPGLSYLMSAKLKTEFLGEEIEEDIKDESEKLNITGNVGVGYAMQNGFGVGARYSHGFSNLIKDDPDDEKMQTRTIQISIFKRF